MKPGSLAETIRYAVLPWITIKNGTSIDKVLSDIPRDAPYRSACQSVLYTACRARAYSAAVLRRLASRDPDAKVKAILELALSLLKQGDVKAFTVCDQAVTAAKADPETRGAANFINAVLRRYLREKERLSEILFKDPVVRCNAPFWWIKRYEDVFKSEARGIFTLQAKHPPLTLRVNTARVSQETMLARFQAENIRVFPEGLYGIRLEQAMPVSSIPGFSEGLVSVQDAGSQLAAVFLGAEAGMRVLDACAAPGGKTAHILELAPVRMTALEIDPKRSERIRENLERLGLSAEVITADAANTASWWDGKPFDRILLDAPCTASGIVRRHPDIPWSRQPQDIAALARTQKALLENLWGLLAKGGRILYAVCSVFPEEGPLQIESFCRSHPDAWPIPIGPRGETLLSLKPQEGLQLQPGKYPVTHDGFFYCLLEKI